MLIYDEESDRHVACVEDALAACCIEGDQPRRHLRGGQHADGQPDRRHEGRIARGWHKRAQKWAEETGKDNPDFGKDNLDKDIRSWWRAPSSSTSCTTSS